MGTCYSETISDWNGTNMTTTLERRQALRDIRDTVRDWGQPLKFYIRKESQITRGSLGSKVASTIENVEIPAYPIQRNPDSKQLSQAGLSFQGSALIYTSALSWFDAGYLDLDALELSNFDVSRMTVGMDGKEWAVAEVGFANRINGSPTYVTFSLK